MNKTINLLSFVFLLVGILMISSCKKDDDPIIDPGVDGINVGDGLYLKLGDNDPASSAGLSSEVVATDGLGGATQERSGFNAGYVYLEAGDYSVVQIQNKEITATFGGSSEIITDDGSFCDHNDYTLVKTEADGASFNIASEGLYKVSHDGLRNELIFYKIDEVGVIGSATEGAWSTDTPLSGSVSATGGSWTATGVVLREGDWKIRFNCRWSLERRDDIDAGFDASNGYQMFTNLGGSLGDLIPGGANIAQTEDGEYTLTMDWSPQNGWAFTSERTGDAPLITFNPDEYQMAVIGDATAGAWDSDQNLFHKEESGVHTWYGVVTFADAGEYKFRANDAWAISLGTDLANLSLDGDNIPTPGAGSWYIVLSTADEGGTWTSSVTSQGWSIIGEGGPSMSWDVDADMDAPAFSDGVSTYTITGMFGEGQWKFRAARDWAHNLGGDPAALTVDGDNLTTTAGSHTVTLSFDGENYTADIQ